MRAHFALPRFTRGLRFRLTLSYALFFTALIIGIGIAFREMLQERLDAETRDVLDQRWVAVKGYLRIENGHADWFYDSKDPDEAYTVEDIRQVFLLTDAEGGFKEWSSTYESLGFDTPEEIHAAIRSQKPVYRVKYTRQHVPYLVRSGVVYDEKHRTPYFMAIGRSLSKNQQVIHEFKLMYLSSMPLLILSGCFLGWFLAGRALRPVKAVAYTAQRISGSNLSLRIPSRGAGDELDYLITTFNRMIERLQHSFEQIRQFSTDVSHELRTPITAIRGQLEVAVLTAQTSEQYREAILEALQDVERLSDLVRALLLLSQAESGQLALQTARFDLASLARDIVDQFQIPAEAGHVTLQAELQEQCWAEVDRIQFERMVSNLLSNAIKFTPPGGRVLVRVRKVENEIEIAVEDTGCGIAPEHLPHIFDRFYRVRTPEPGPEKGLGLGLSFVAWIAKAHRGEVHVESEPAKGTRFTVRLPAATAQPGGAEILSRPAPAAANS